MNEKGMIPTISPNGSIKYDYEDLRILEKLQVDATRSLGEISRELKMPYQQVYYHFGHITDQGQISLYRIVWPATGPRSQEELKAWQQHHAHQGLRPWSGTPPSQSPTNFLNKIGRLPFNWANGGGEGSFLSECVIPLEYYSETFQYLSEAVAGFEGKDRVLHRRPGQCLVVHHPRAPVRQGGRRLGRRRRRRPCQVQEAGSDGQGQEVGSSVVRRRSEPRKKPTWILHEKEEDSRGQLIYTLNPYSMDN